MSEETTGAPAGMEPAAGGTGAPSAAPAAPAYDKGDYDARIANEPEFAKGEVKRLTTELLELQKSSKATETFLDMAKTVSPGNPEAGVQTLVEAIRRQSQIANDPKMSKLVNEWLNGGKFPDELDAGTADDPFAEDINNSSAVQELRKELAATKGLAAQQMAQSNLRDFFDSTDEGKALTPEEQGEVLSEIQGSIQRAQQQGQTQYLDNLSQETIRTVVANWMSRTGKLGEIGERIARARAEAKNAASTGEPPSSIGTGVETETKYSNKLSEAVAQFAKEQGVDLWNPKVR